MESLVREIVIYCFLIGERFRNGFKKNLPADLTRKAIAEADKKEDKNGLLGRTGSETRKHCGCSMR